MASHIGKKQTATHAFKNFSLWQSKDICLFCQNFFRVFLRIPFFQFTNSGIFYNADPFLTVFSPIPAHPTAWRCSTWSSVSREGICSPQTFPKNVPLKCFLHAPFWLVFFLLLSFYDFFALTFSPAEFAPLVWLVVFLCAFFSSDCSYLVYELSDAEILCRANRDVVTRLGIDSGTCVW